MLLLFVLSLAGALVAAETVRPATPPMGWNSYNKYNCFPSEAIMKANAAGLVEQGFDKAGYNIVTTDCGWSSTFRSETGQLVWNTSTFPAGGQALSDYIHGLGLKFGMYSGAGHFQCGSYDQVGSLGHETVDAESFAAWGADYLKYDNCFANSTTLMADYYNPVSTSPERFVVMADALNKTTRDIMYEICQWGVGEDIASWAAPLATTWRMSNDIYNAWRSVWRITNQVVPYYKHTTVGAYPDMDMLLVGLNVLSLDEERFHFGMWAINKSPLTIGAAMNTNETRPESLDILKNPDVIAINQDPLGKAAQLVRRWGFAEVDIWLGELSGDRLVLAIANWKNESQAVTVRLPADLGIASAGKVRDAWAGKDLPEPLADKYETDLAAHELRLLVLSDLKIATAGVQKSGGYYTAALNATLSGAAKLMPCDVGKCLPAGTKVVDIGLGQSKAAVTFTGVTAASVGTKLLGVDYVHYDVAHETAFQFGDNTRNLTIAVNSEDPAGGTRFPFPVSGANWYESGRLFVYVDGFTAGSNNKVVFTASGEATTFAPDLVGFEIFDVPDVAPLQ